jgi:DNA-binding NarL/FixJ family response regulator
MDLQVVPADQRTQAPSHVPQGGTPRGTTTEFSRLWGSLTSGQHKISESFFTEREAKFVLVASGEVAPRGLTPRRRYILEQVLLAADRKVVAAELGLAESTIHALLKQSLKFFGLDCVPGQLPALLVIAARAALRSTETMGCWVAEQDVANGVSVASAPRPELCLRTILSPSEFAVVELMLEGKSYAEIARLRRTAARTVANQVAASFRLLGVSGRSQLLRRLILGPPFIGSESGSIGKSEPTSAAPRLRASAARQSPASLS